MWPSPRPLTLDTVPARPILIRPVPGPVDLLSTPWASAPTAAWIRRGQGMLGWGIAATARFSGAERFSRAQRWVGDWLAQAAIDDTLGAPGVGPIAFSSFTFDDESAGSVVVIPRTLVGWRDGVGWRIDVVLTADDDPGTGAGASGLADLVAAGPPAPVPPSWRDETASAAEWTSSVREAVKRIAAGELDKVVLARQVRADFATPAAVSPVLARLGERYPECWTFHVDGLVGATPELLVRRSRDRVMSRVLAGSVPSSGSDAIDLRTAEAMQLSSKQLSEHEYAVRSVAHALAIHCTDLSVPAHPDVLRLANVQHLATDVTGSLADGSTALALAASLHPTAAVCGTPTERAQAVISELENLDRGRYSGPVGWFDGNGEGEFGIALRCAQFSPDWRQARLLAGCGLVADSDSAAELAESEVKLAAMRWALSG